MICSTNLTFRGQQMASKRSIEIASRNITEQQKLIIVRNVTSLQNRSPNNHVRLCNVSNIYTAAFRIWSQINRKVSKEQQRLAITVSKMPYAGLKVKLTNMLHLLVRFYTFEAKFPIKASYRKIKNRPGPDLRPVSPPRFDHDCNKH